LVVGAIAIVVAIAIVTVPRHSAAATSIVKVEVERYALVSATTRVDFHDCSEIVCPARLLYHPYSGRT
jgi:hypothetical protein